MADDLAAAAGAEGLLLRRGSQEGGAALAQHETVGDLAGIAPDVCVGVALQIAHVALFIALIGDLHQLPDLLVGKDIGGYLIRHGIQIMLHISALPDHQQHVVDGVPAALGQEIGAVAHIRAVPAEIESGRVDHKAEYIVRDVLPVLMHAHAGAQPPAEAIPIQEAGIMALHLLRDVLQVIGGVVMLAGGGQLLRVIEGDPLGLRDAGSVLGLFKAAHGQPVPHEGDVVDDGDQFIRHEHIGQGDARLVFRKGILHKDDAQVAHGVPLAGPVIISRGPDDHFAGVPELHGDEDGVVEIAVPDLTVSRDQPLIPVGDGQIPLVDVGMHHVPGPDHAGRHAVHIPGEGDAEAHAGAAVNGADLPGHQGAGAVGRGSAVGTAPAGLLLVEGACGADGVHAPHQGRVERVVDPLLRVAAEVVDAQDIGLFGLYILDGNAAGHHFVVDIGAGEEVFMVVAGIIRVAYLAGVAPLGGKFPFRLGGQAVSPPGEDIEPVQKFLHLVEAHLLLGTVGVRPRLPQAHDRIPHADGDFRLPDVEIADGHIAHRVHVFRAQAGVGGLPAQGEGAALHKDHVEGGVELDARHVGGQGLHQQVARYGLSLGGRGRRTGQDRQQHHRCQEDGQYLLFHPLRLSAFLMSFSVGSL